MSHRQPYRRPYAPAPPAKRMTAELADELKRAFRRPAKWGPPRRRWRWRRSFDWSSWGDDMSYDEFDPDCGDR